MDSAGRLWKRPSRSISISDQIGRTYSSVLIDPKTEREFSRYPGVVVAGTVSSGRLCGHRLTLPDRELQLAAGGREVTKDAELQGEVRARWGGAGYEVNAS